MRVIVHSLVVLGLGEKERGGRERERERERERKRERERFGVGETYLSTDRKTACLLIFSLSHTHPLLHIHIYTVISIP